MGIPKVDVAAIARTVDLSFATRGTKSFGLKAQSLRKWDGDVCLLTLRQKSTSFRLNMNMECVNVMNGQGLSRKRKSRGLKMSSAQDVEYVQTFNINAGDHVDFIDAAGHFVSRTEVLGVRENIALVKLLNYGLIMEVRKTDLLKIVPYDGSAEQKEDLARLEKREQELASKSFAKIMEQGL